MLGAGLEDSRKVAAKIVSSDQRVEVTGDSQLVQFGRSQTDCLYHYKKKVQNDWLELQQLLSNLGADVQVEVLEGQSEQVSTRINDETPTSSTPNQTYQRKIDGGWSIVNMF